MTIGVGFLDLERLAASIMKITTIDVEVDGKTTVGVGVGVGIGIE